jgi:DNA-binding MarR family transcriptional regulator
VGYIQFMTDELSLDRQLCFALYAASRAMTAVYRPVLDELGITYPQYLVLLALWEQDGRGVGELCEELSLDTGTLSPMLKRLGALGLVERQRLASDERRVEIRLTERGRALRAQACDIPRRLAGAAGMPLAEVDELRTTLAQLTHSLNTYTALSTYTREETR